MVQFNALQIAYTTIPAILIVMGVILMNGGEQFLKHHDTQVSDLIGKISFIIGWIILAFTLSLTRKDMLQKVFIFGSCLIVLVSAIVSKLEIKDRKSKVPDLIWPFLFSVAWIVLGWTSSNKNYLGFLGSLFVIASMIVFLPIQRKYCVVDGPGMSCFLLGWVLLILGNAMIKK